MMERIERKMKNMLLANIGAAAVTREQSEALVRALIEKGEEAIDHSGIRDEYPRFDREGNEAEGAAQADTDAWLECLCELSPEQLQLLKDAINAVERTSRQLNACEAAQNID